ncbi:uncharacterized protein LOC120351458 [Nilaparvata lugens]|uniref:uncharacterized protein LOC120351458 n=1 Tax=Nilaparvata lugens TaxID=108931 RepID=UPI00193E00A4|nr:uncharacterized protein LOC120351458 [Nilaparvata lugens]
MTKLIIWKSISNFFKSERLTIFDSLTPLVRFSMFFGTTSVRVEKSRKTFTYRLFDLPRFLTSIYILYYIHNGYRLCFTKIDVSTLYLRFLCTIGTTEDVLHVLIPILTGMSFVKQIKMIHKFDNHIKNMPNVRKLYHSGSGLIGAVVQCSLCGIMYPFIVYDYVRLRRPPLFIISLFFIGMHSLDKVIWFLVMIHELSTRFRWLKIEMADTVRRLESAGCDQESVEAFLQNPSKRFVASELSKDEILLECLRLSYSKLLSISDQLVSTLGSGMLLTIFQNIITIVFYDFYVYMYLMREINAGTILAAHKLLIIWTAVCFSEKLMNESKAILLDLQATKLTRLSKFSRLQVEIIQAEINAKPLRVHVCNLFVLNKTFFAALLSTTLTYFIVMMQMISTISTIGVDKGAYIPPI